MSVRPVSALVAAVLMQCWHAAQAADPATLPAVRVGADAEAEAPYTVEASTSAVKLPLSLRDTPQSLTVLTSERIADQGLQSLRDALDITPGVYSYQYDTERVVFTARGFKIDSLQYDGVPAASSWITDSLDDTLDTAVYERIEVVRGATGLLTGAGSPSASINLVRKHADSQQLELDVGATAGSWNDRRIEADLNTPLNASGTVRGRLVAVYQDKESYQALYQLEKQLVYGIVDADLGERTRASIGFDYQDHDPRGNTWGSFPLYLGDGTLADWSRSVTTAADWTRWDRRRKSVFAELTHGFGNGWEARGSVSLRKSADDVTLLYMYGFPDPATGEGLDPYAYRSREGADETAFDAYVSGPLELFGATHELVVGFNGSDAQYDGQEFAAGATSPTGNFFAWDGSYANPGFATEGTLLTDTDTMQQGFYAAGRFTLGEATRLVAGARLSRYETTYYNLYENPEGRHRYDFDELTPYAGLVRDLGDTLSVFASYTEIFKPQNNRDVTGKFLDPVAGESLELGLKGEYLDGRVNASLTAFETRQDNVGAPLLDPETGEPVLLADGITTAQVAIDGTVTRGFEFEVAGALSEQWNLALGVTRYSLRDADGADVRSFIPRTLIRLFTTWAGVGPFADLTLGGGVNWQSSSSTIVGAPDGGAVLTQGSIPLISLMARYRLSDRASLQLNVENLTDRKYLVLDEFDNSYYGAPANVSLSLRLGF